MDLDKRPLSFGQELAIGGPGVAAPARPWRIPYGAVGPAVMGMDALLIVLIGTLSGMGYHSAAFGRAGDPLAYVAHAAVVAALFVSIAKARNLYDPAELLNLKSQ